jgi:Mn-containing catalase
LYAITDNFPPGKLQGIAPFTDMYVNTSQGEGDMTGSWNNGPQWSRVDDLQKVMPSDKGDGEASVKLSRQEESVAKKVMARTASDPEVDPPTGADLGAGAGAGKITGGENTGAAKNIQHASKTS